MNVPRDYFPKWNKSERERQIPYDITYMWNLKQDTNEPIYERETTQRQRNQMCGCQGGGRVGEICIGSLGLADANYNIENR